MIKESFINQSGSCLKMKVWVTLLISGQSVIALALSMAPVRHFEAGLKFDNSIYIFNFFLLFFFCFGVVLLTRRPIIISIICMICCNTIAVINYYELLFHGTVLTHQDVRNINTAIDQMSNYNFCISLPIIIILVTLAGSIVYLCILSIKKKYTPRNLKGGAISFALFILCSYCLAFAPFSKKGSYVWSWEIKYFTDGFVVGTLENIQRTIKPFIKPSGYADVSDYSAEGIQGTTEEYPDIILILNETWYDLNHYSDFYTDTDYMGNYRSMDAVKGYAAVPFVGGGTNASEYELLTSNSMTLLNTSTPFNDLDFKGSNTLISYLKDLGYTTMAAHPARERNYHRGAVWKNIGFDSRYFVDAFSDLEYIENRKWYATDKSAFRQFCRFYESMDANQPRFAFLLTIQNHGDWDFNSPEADSVHIQNARDLSDYDTQRINEYLSCVKATDDFLDELFGYYSNIDRKVVVYMVGDHCPSIISLLEGSGEDNLKKRQVPYFIWTNYQTKTTEQIENQMVDLCALTPLALKISGVPISPYYTQLIKLSEESICVTNIVSDTDKEIGCVLKGGQIANIEMVNSIRDYFYMEYDNLIGDDRNDVWFNPPE